MKLKINWFKIVSDLERNKMTQSHQAMEVDVSQVSIYYWKTEKAEPSFSNGLAIIDLYKSVIGTTEGLVK